MSPIRAVSRLTSTIIATLGVFASVAPSSASLFLDYSGGAAISFSDPDDGAQARGFWVEQGFFGQAIPAPSYGQVTVSVNGHLRIGDGSPNDYDPSPLGSTSVNRIAPMWMDFNLGEGGQIIESIGASDAYYAVTWLNMEKTGLSGYFANFQAIIFESATVLNDVQFSAGDIVFSYGDIGIYYAPEAPELTQTTIGLENAGGDYAALYRPDVLGDYNGVYAYPTFEEDFPVGENEYMLFRPDGNGNYNVTIETFAIPEPSAFTALAGGLVLASAVLRRRRR
jgi:hypothetical protein